VTDAERLSPGLAVLAAIRFLAELGLLAALGYIGWRLGGTVALSVVLAAVLPLAAALVWGRWVAPRADRRLPDPSRLGVEITLFAGAFLGLLLTGSPPGAAVAGVMLWAAFLVSSPVRRRGL
jgi:hypothetical protein